ncbi:hypothetical protein JAAARDRAFT_71035 [Jaapia argillacea MUCL 33604]|uniref:Uncharacterized protein n=1 Tax=Jaapia argillacea MUCL 33604 TaxID=933084 RepID=A0A067PL98_9AGAM|nr:hypothetical protein JAAARDRAFT_71035 [Jaapia argillacea MUCL 33604]
MGDLVAREFPSIKHFTFLDRYLGEDTPLSIQPDGVLVDAVGRFTHLETFIYAFPTNQIQSSFSSPPLIGLVHQVVRALMDASPHLHQVAFMSERANTKVDLGRDTELVTYTRHADGDVREKDDLLSLESWKYLS